MLKMMSIKALAFKSGIPAAAIEIPTYMNLINGSIAGAIAGYLTNPFDVLKTRLMVSQ